MVEPRRGVILYGYGVDAVAQALRELDPRYALVDRFGSWPGQVPVLCCPNGAAADAARQAASGVAWLVVELYRPGIGLAHAGDPLLTLNTVTVDAATAARAITQPDLVTWYEVVNPVRVRTVDGAPVVDDYSNVTIVVPDGHQVVAHAVSAGGVAPKCLPHAAELILRSDDLWALVRLRGAEVCPACVLRRG